MAEKQIIVRFVRIKPAREDEISHKLQTFYNDGWRVVSHSQDREEYTFVMEMEEEADDYTSFFPLREEDVVRVVVKDDIITKE